MRRSFVAVGVLTLFGILGGSIVSADDVVALGESDLLARLAQVESELAAMRNSLPASGDVAVGEDCKPRVVPPEE